MPMSSSNTIRVMPCTADAGCPLVSGESLREYTKYLVDESRKSGWADALALPRSADEVCAALAAARECEWAVTVSGARTGITAGAVPDGGLVLSVERMNRVLGMRETAEGELLVRCQPGVLLKDVQRSLREMWFADSRDWSALDRALLERCRERGGRMFFPPDPTETSASIGGMAACNASGAHTFRYGPMRPYVQALEIALVDGGIIRAERGQCRADASGGFQLLWPDGTAVSLTVPHYPQPRTKNVAGYFSGQGMDLVDLFVGSEGTLGIFTEIEIRAIPAPETACAVMLFWPDEAKALAFTDALRAVRRDVQAEAIEYFDPGAMQFLRARRQQFGAASGVPECLPAGAACATYLDIGTSRTAMAAELPRLAMLAARFGADPEVCWSAVEADERERLRQFRHALPEAVNSRISEIQRDYPEVTKLGTDMAVPDEALAEVMRMYRTALEDAGLDYVIFGHIGDNHLHVNILPRNPDEYRLGKRLYFRFAEEIVGMGGSPAAEHGIGKLKKEFLQLMIGDEGIAQMRAVKAAFDPHGRLGRGTLFA
jgi:D-lactate dehydrogenase (cytochrome)